MFVCLLTEFHFHSQEIYQRIDWLLSSLLDSLTVSLFVHSSTVDIRRNLSIYHRIMICFNFVYRFVCLFICLFDCLFICLFVYWSIDWFVCLFVYLCINMISLSFIANDRLVVFSTLFILNFANFDDFTLQISNFQILTYLK